MLCLKEAHHAKGKDNKAQVDPEPVAIDRTLLGSQHDIIPIKRKLHESTSYTR
jgi:hypothetical protein